ncbi:DUF3263 domain-containing protein [Rhodococcus sp. B10]|uniref:DUF3263 domain-containing protein n=1 Tax=Rhodococcus sp. B10 TaxID=2695876 RepID=UPI0014301B94|nr:DUF3263 domain-containing protein [Rhodococcus sp. B10]NIL77680.1 hypothetical protein [Rhodococcus sp. B10]
MKPYELKMLEIEKRFYKSQAGKEVDIALELMISPVRYYQLLNELLDNPEALAAEPVLVNRLRRIRDSKAKVRRAS